MRRLLNRIYSAFGKKWIIYSLFIYTLYCIEVNVAGDFGNKNKNRKWCTVNGVYILHTYILYTFREIFQIFFWEKNLHTSCSKHGRCFFSSPSFPLKTNLNLHPGPNEWWHIIYLIYSKSYTSLSYTQRTAQSITGVSLSSLTSTPLYSIQPPLPPPFGHDPAYITPRPPPLPYQSVLTVQYV